MKTCSSSLVFACTVLLTSAILAAEPPEGFVTLFDGKTLAGWEGNEKMFRVEDGAIVGGTLKEKIPRNEFLCTTKEYENFELRLKVKALGEGVNAGIQFRTKRTANHHEVSGYQADVGAGWWGKLYEEHGRALLWDKPGDQHVKPGQWNDYRIVADGSRIRTYVNGNLCVDLDDPQGTRRGIIAFQIHSGGPLEVRFRKLELTVK